jgi:hypothetical protein
VVPYVKRELSKNRIGHINASNYSDNSNIGDDDIVNFKFTHEYYNTKNIYYNVGYWNEEYYRLGIVYIYEDGSLSPVFNTIGYEMINPTDYYYDNYPDEKHYAPSDVSFKNFEYLDVEENGFIKPSKN